MVLSASAAASARAPRRAVVLLVVITLLTLFAVVGVTFVIFAQAEASAARVIREAESQQRPDMDPEMLLAYFLSQFIYDTDNPQSALRGTSLARTMYGRAGNTVAFNGSGRLHTAAPDKYYQLDCTQYGGVPINPDDFGAPNVPFTYPDFNNPYLAAQRGSDGEILIPSYVRIAQVGQPPITLRPDRTHHTQFPAQADAGGDVKNLANSPGYRDPATGQLVNNDSIWIDLGFPVMKGPDGRKFKPLFAPHIQDLDNRVNVNAHGNRLGIVFNEAPVGLSHQGWCPGEVSLDKVFTGAAKEARNLLEGANGVSGKYDMNRWGGGLGSYRLDDKYAPASMNYCPATNLDCWPNTYLQELLPDPGTGLTCIRHSSHAHSHGWWKGYDKTQYPTLYNLFDPGLNIYWQGGVLQNNLQDRRFSVSNMEPLLRYTDTGSPALGSELFVLCPASLASAKTRRQLTTHSFDVSRPGVYPFIVNNQGYTLAAGDLFPKRPPLDFPVANPGTGEFGPNYYAMSNAAAAKALLARIDINRLLRNYPELANNQFNDPAGAATSHAERVQLAQEIFDVLRAVTGAADPATVDPTTQTTEFDALRWLAQLAVNMVDYVQWPQPSWPPRAIDVMTSFNWNPRFKSDPKQGWVFGTVLPRLVINEAYIEVANDPADLTQPTANKYNVNCWVELHNPQSGNGANKVSHHDAVPATEDHTARLYVGAPGSGGYAVYKVVIAQTVDPNDATKDNRQELRKADNVLGTPLLIKSTVDDYGADATTQTLKLAGDDLNKVQPVNTADGPYQSCNPGENRGYYVLGPTTAFPGTSSDPNFFASNAKQKMSYVYTPADPAAPAFNTLRHTLVLQRLANPYLPPQNNPNAAGYNPYVTVDFIADVAANDAVKVDGVNNTHMNTAVDQRKSYGRNQPYAAHHSQQVTQKPAAAPPAGQPPHSLFRMNSQGADAAGKDYPAFAFDYLTWMNRPLCSTIELLHASCHKPSELTQQFMQGTNAGTGQPTSRFRHEAPWFEPDGLLYRALEFIEAGMRTQLTPIGGRNYGRININTIWDIEIFQALGDSQGINYFTNTGVDNVYQRLLTSRSPDGKPGPNDKPFRGLAVANAPAGVQYPAGSGIDDTFLRSDPADAATPMGQRRRLLEPRQDGVELRAQGRDHPYFRYELMNKIFSNVTTRSNVFAVWLTVGFFEVVDDSDATRPAKLGREIGSAENRQVRHRMFAVVDRTNLTVGVDAVGQPQVGTAGPRPFFIDSQSAVTGAFGPETVNVAVTSGKYEEISWQLADGMRLVVDPGPNQEVVTITGAPTATSFQATFTKPHPLGFAITNAMPGNPGPQPNFDPRNPQYGGVVRYFSIIK